MKSKQPETIQILVVEVGNQYNEARDDELQAIGDQFQKALDNDGGVVVARYGINVTAHQVSTDVTNVFVVQGNAAPQPSVEEVTEVDSTDEQEGEANV